jgi:hypothetical protein
MTHYLHVRRKRTSRSTGPTSAPCRRQRSDRRTWALGRWLLEGRVDSYIYAIYSRLSQILTDAVHDGIVMRNPCSRRILLGMGKQGSRETSDQGVGTPV